MDDRMRSGRSSATMPRMEAVEAMSRCGGVGDHATLVRLCSRRKLRGALMAGTVMKVAHGRYALPTANVALVAAQRVGGIVSHRSAAAWWGWELKEQPPVPEVTVPKHRRCDRAGVRLFWVDLHADDIREGTVTSRERTLVDCLRSLPFDEALAIADSALRHGDLTFDQLQTLARSVRGPGAPRVRRVAAFRTGGPRTRSSRSCAHLRSRRGFTWSRRCHSGTLRSTRDPT